MKLNKANTQLGVTFNVIEFEPSDILAAVQDPAQLARIVECVCADRRQKVALVDARYDLSMKIGLNDESGKPLEPAGLGFQRKVKGTGDDATWGETDNEHINRFIDALADGSFTVEGFTPPAGDAKAKATAATKWLQSVADKCGDAVATGGHVNGKPVITVNDDGAPTGHIADGTTCYVLDLARAIRKPGQGPGIPKYALEGADAIIKNGNQEKWFNNFTNGYTSATGIVIDPFPFTDFRTVAPHHATPEEKEAVHQANRKALARAIFAARTQENEKATKQEFA